MNQKAVTILLTGPATAIADTCTLLLTAHAWLMSMSMIPFAFENKTKPQNLTVKLKRSLDKTNYDHREPSKN